MVPGDADLFVAQLAARGLTSYRKDVAEDVAVVSPDKGLLRPCAWLELGRWGPVMIAWLAGTKRGDLHAPAGWNAADRAVQHVSAEEAKQRLEFRRCDDNVDVYRDRTTGQEVYVGRVPPSAGASQSRHNDLYTRAWNLVQGLILLHGQAEGQLDRESLRNLHDGIPLLEEVV